MSDLARTRLPNRRLHLTETVAWKENARPWLAGIGFDEAGKAREVFLTWHEGGTDLEVLMADACIVVSILLQAGVGADWLLERLRARDGGKPTGAVEPSLLARLIERAAVIEREDGAAIREFHLCADRRHPLQLRRDEAAPDEVAP